MLQSPGRRPIAEAARRLYYYATSLVLGASAFAADPDDPAAERASFQVADGFAVSLFASEKDGVVKPIQMKRYRMC